MNMTRFANRLGALLLAAAMAAALLCPTALAEAASGWQEIDGRMQHFGADGTAHETQTVDTRTCTTDGYALTTCKTCGATYRGALLHYTGHTWDAQHVCTRCGTQGRNIADAEVTTGYTVYSGGSATCAVTVTYQGEPLTVRADDTDADGRLTYTDNTHVGLGTVTICGLRDYYGTVSAQYAILPATVRDAAAVEIGQRQIRLSWPAVAGAEHYRVEMSADGETWTELPMTARTAYTVTGLDGATAYRFRLRGCTNVDGVWYTSPYASNEVRATTLPAGQFAPSELLGGVRAQVDGQTVSDRIVDGERYLFLPARADLHSLALTVDTQNCTAPTVELCGELGTQQPGGAVDVPALAAVRGGARELTIRINGAAAGTVHVMQSAGLNALYITRDAAGAARLRAVAPDGTAVYDGALTQLTASGDEKPSYDITLAQASDLAGGASGTRWSLCAEDSDATLLHGKCLRDFAAGLGAAAPAAGDWADLYDDGVYCGTYLVRAASDAPAAVHTARGAVLCAQDDAAGLGAAYPAFEDAVYAQAADGSCNGYNAATGKYYYEYCDLTSLVQVCLLQSLASNADAADAVLLFYQDASGLLHAGLAGDMTLTCGTGRTARIAPEDDFVNGRYLITALLRIPGFRAAVSNYYHTVFLPQAQRLTADGGAIRAAAGRITASAAMNFTFRPLVRTADPDAAARLWPAGTTHADTVDAMTAWLDARLTHLSAAYDHTWDAGVVTAAPTCTAASTRVYTSDTGATMTETVPPTGHTPEVIPAVAPTCTTDGRTEGSRCAVCGVILTAPETVPAGHRYVNDVCTVCGAWAPDSPPCPGGETCPGSRFTDMPSTSNWAHTGIDFVLRHGLLGGTSATTFSPDARLTRAMLVQILYHMDGEPDVAAGSAFTDVSADAWYAHAVTWAVTNGIAGGVGGGCFDPNGAVTREQTAAILRQYARYRGCDVSAGADLSAYADADSVSSYAREAMAWAVAERLIGGATVDGRTYLMPRGATTRAQFATILMQYVRNVIRP